MLATLKARSPLLLVVLAVALLIAVGWATSSSRGGSPAGGDGAGGAMPDLGLHGTELGEPWPRPSFQLTTTEGRPFDFARETAGRLTLLFFGYTSCPDVCPIHLAVLAEALQQPGMPRPLVVFVGIDPTRDTPAAVRRFLDGFDPSFVGLVGTPAELEAAQVATGVPVAIADPPDADGDYLVGHASQVIGYTADDVAHVVYPFGTRMQDWVHDLPRLATMAAR